MDWPRLSDLDTSHPQVAEAVAAAREWGAEKIAGNDGISLILSGPNGVGKTHIANSILWSMRYFPDDSVTNIQIPLGRFHMASDLILGMEPYKTERGPAVQVNPSYFVGRSPIVIVDDIGGQINMPYISADRQKEEIHARYFMFVDHCINRNIEQWASDGSAVIESVHSPPSLIMTTNLSLENGVDSEFARHVGSRVWDRLQEICPSGMMVGMDGVPSYRAKLGGR